MPRDDSHPFEPERQREAGGTALILTGGLTLCWLCARDPAALPVIAPWQFSWTTYLGTTLSLWWFARGLRIIPLAGWRRAAFCSGVALIYTMLQTRADYWAQHMFFLNQIQHSVLQSIGPFLIAIAAPGATLQAGLPRALRGTPLRLTQHAIHLLQEPALVSLLFVAAGAVWLIPSIQFRAMLDPALYGVMNASLVLSGLLFWCFLLDPKPLPRARAALITRTAIALVIGLPMIGIGTTISTEQSDLYVNFALCGRLIAGIGAVADQQIGAIILWMPAGLLSGMATLLLAKRLFEEDDRLMMERLTKTRR